MNQSRPASMSSFWMPFTNNRDYKAHPRLLVSAEGMYYKDVDGNAILDGTAGLWCVPCGHAQPQIVAAIREMAGQMDFAPTFQMGHPAAFDLAEKLMDYTGHRFGHVFYTNSGSEAVDTALKMALAYHKARGESSPAFRLVETSAWNSTGSPIAMASWSAGDAAAGSAPTRSERPAWAAVLFQVPWWNW